MVHFQRSLGGRSRQLCIKRCGREAIGLAVLIGVGIKNCLDAGQRHRGKAHRAGMAARIDDAAIQSWTLQLQARGPDRHQLGMGGRIGSCRRLVDAGGDDRAILDDDRAERPPALPHIFAGQINRLSEELFRFGHGKPFL